MNFQKTSLSLLLVVFAGLLAGCVSIPMGSMENDARAKSFRVRPGKAKIYVFRHESIGFAIPMTVALDGRVAGQTLAQTYLMWEVKPGPHRITSHAEDISSVKLNAKPGKVYYIWQEVKIGLWKARSLLRQVDEQTGRKWVMECKLGKSNI